MDTKCTYIIGFDICDNDQLRKTFVKKLEDASGFKITDAAGLGIGAPGLIDCKNGVIGFSGFIVCPL